MLLPRHVEPRRRRRARRDRRARPGQAGRCGRGAEAGRRGGAPARGRRRDRVRSSRATTNMSDGADALEPPAAGAASAGGLRLSQRRCASAAPAECAPARQTFGMEPDDPLAARLCRRLMPPAMPRPAPRPRRAPQPRRPRARAAGARLRPARRASWPKACASGCATLSRRCARRRSPRSRSTRPRSTRRIDARRRDARARRRRARDPAPSRRPRAGLPRASPPTGRCCPTRRSNAARCASKPPSGGVEDGPDAMAPGDRRGAAVTAMLRLSPPSPISPALRPRWPAPLRPGRRLRRRAARSQRPGRTGRRAVPGVARQRTHAFAPRSSASATAAR